MVKPVIHQVPAAMRRSELLRAAAAVRADGGLAFALGTDEPRPLTPAEAAALERLGNSADDWSRVRVADGFDWRRVRQCQFHGDVVLGRFTGAVRLPEGVELPAGVYHSTVADSVIGHGAMVRDVHLLARCAVGEGAVVANCGTV